MNKNLGIVDYESSHRDDGADMLNFSNTLMELLSRWLGRRVGRMTVRTVTQRSLPRS
jgi:hypothetical protein